jgi:hypothetical protein
VEAYNTPSAPSCAQCMHHRLFQPCPCSFCLSVI